MSIYISEKIGLTANVGKGKNVMPYLNGNYISLTNKIPGVVKYVYSS